MKEYLAISDALTFSKKSDLFNLFAADRKPSIHIFIIIIASESDVNLLHKFCEGPTNVSPAMAWDWAIENDPAKKTI
jgi:hypothetical protein